MELGTNIKKFRTDAGFTQEELAAKLSVSAQAVSKWERGDTEPSPAQFCRLAEIFSIPPTHLLGGNISSSEETFINSCYDNLSLAESLGKAFELQFYTITGLAKHAMSHRKTDWWNINAEIPPNRVHVETPPNRVSWNNKNCITAFSSVDTCHMMYNGDDANIAFSMMPANDKMCWLINERDRLSDYLSLIGNKDFLCCIRYMISTDFPVCYSAEHLADKTGLPVEKVSNTLDEATRLGICWTKEKDIDTKSVKLYTTNDGQMLCGILTLAYLSLPKNEKNGHYLFACPAKHTISERA